VASRCGERHGRLGAIGSHERACSFRYPGPSRGCRHATRGGPGPVPRFTAPTMAGTGTPVRSRSWPSCSRDVRTRSGSMGPPRGTRDRSGPRSPPARAAAATGPAGAGSQRPERRTRRSTVAASRLPNRRLLLASAPSHVGTATRPLGRGARAMDPGVPFGASPAEASCPGPATGVHTTFPRLQEPGDW
jgi:hypothetical protein